MAYIRENIYAESSSSPVLHDLFEQSSAESSDDSEEISSQHSKNNNIFTADEITPSIHCGPTNLVQKLFERERNGWCWGSSCGPYRPIQAFKEVPIRLSFLLKDIIPKGCFGHIFMGLTACGQFFLSYKVEENEEGFPFECSYKYTLYFWIYRPHKPLKNYFTRSLFDDHSVECRKHVTMVQWKNADNRVLIVHGGAKAEPEDTYITYVKVPKLGCRDCRNLGEFYENGHISSNALCMTCNLTIHTKYSFAESDPKFDPYTHFICPENILITSNGFLHMLRVDIEAEPKHESSQICSIQNHMSVPIQLSQLKQMQSPQYDPPVTERRPSQATDETIWYENHNNIVARIIADFSDIETDSTQSSSSRHDAHRQPRRSETHSPVICFSYKTYDELIFTCSGSSSSGPSSSTCANGISGVSRGSIRGNLLTQKGRRHHRVTTKFYRNGVTTVDLQGSSSSSIVDKSNTYEFSEDNEKCEKISTLRKRRLAEKKYEFSEDNSENIIPFAKIRSAGKAYASPFNNLHRPASSSHLFHNSPCTSPSSSPHPSQASSGCESRHCTPPPIHRMSPISPLLQQGFRSPPYQSPVGSASSRRSPSRHMSSTQIYNQKSPQASYSQTTQQIPVCKPLGTLSPLQVSMTKRGHLEFNGAVSPSSSVPFLSPRREEHRIVEIPLQGNSMPERPTCTKKVKRRYVEEDDALSVITSVEDDCISPGYHTSLPLEVHGSCYSEMQMISQTNYQKLQCASVVITQHSFDLEPFTYYAISALCQKNQMTYDFIYDWACDLIMVCPLSNTTICVLMAQFAARELLPTAFNSCLNCARKLDCAYHRHKYECRILFNWNMESGEWDIIDYGELAQCDLGGPMKKMLTVAQRTKKLAQEMVSNLGKSQANAKNMRVLTSDISKSKSKIIDLDHSIEFYLRPPRYLC